MGLLNRNNNNNRERRGLLSGGYGSDDEKYDIDSVNRSIENAKTRISEAGYEPKTDSRNWFEKATNLPEGQNAFFDALELLDRPGNAVRTAIDQRDDTEGVGSNLWQGFSGQEQTRGTDLLDDVGLDIDNKVGKGIAGFGAEVLTDPLMLVPGGAIAKGMRGAGQGLKTGYRAFAPQRVQEIAEPAIKGVRESVGSMFNPRHGRNRQFDESGTRIIEGDDKLTPMIRDTQNKIAYQGMQNMENLSNTAKNVGYNRGDEVGEVMEFNLQQFDESGNVIPRPNRRTPQGFDAEVQPMQARRTTSDSNINMDANFQLNRRRPTETLRPRNEETEAIQQAAANLMRSNDAIRQQARDLGINIGEIQGYMRHILSKAERKRRKERGEGVREIDRGNYGVGNPNDRFLKGRELKGQSAREINEEVDRDLFNPNAFFSTAYGQKQLTEYMHAVDFRRKVLSDRSLAIPAKEFKSIPEGTIKINTKNYQFMKDEDLKDMGLLDEVGGEYVVPKAVKTALDQFQRLTTDEGINSFLKAFDKAQSWWKRMALFSVPYHVRNDIGAKFNNFVGGMNLHDIGMYSLMAQREVFKGMVMKQRSKTYDEYLQQGLGANSQNLIEYAVRGEDAEKQLEKALRKQSKGPVGQVGTRLNPLNWFETSREFGTYIDQTNRFAAYKWARDKKNMTPEKAAEFVRKTQFDYTDLTNFEREIMTRFVPFYRWMRNNIPYQLRQFINDPRRYAAVNDLRLNMQGAMGIDEENIPEWMMEQFAIPFKGEDDGSGEFVSMNLPLADLTRVTQPGKMAVDSMSPLPKQVLEQSLNRNFFYNSPIEEFEGQERQLNVPGTDIEWGIPVKQAYALENLTGQIGRTSFDFLQRPEDENQDAKFRMPSLGISNMTKEYDVNRSRFFERLEELRRLQDRINYIEQQTGVRPPTMNDINQNSSGLFGR